MDVIINSLIDCGLKVTYKETPKGLAYFVSIETDFLKLTEPPEDVKCVDVRFMVTFGRGFNDEVPVRDEAELIDLLRVCCKMKTLEHPAWQRFLQRHCHMEEAVAL